MRLFDKREHTADPKDPGQTETVPLVPFKVLRSNIPFYRNKECTDLIADASLAILQALDPEDDIQELDIVPTTKNYSPGDYVNLAFDNKRLWEDCYYRDPDSGEISKAWQIHVEFVGQIITKEAVAKDRVRIEDLERRVEQKIAQLASKKREKAEEVN